MGLGINDTLHSSQGGGEGERYQMHVKFTMDAGRHLLAL